MSRVLVTGATGFVGRHVVEELKARGHEPICLSRRGPTAADITRLLPPIEADAVIHLVGIIQPHLENTFERVHVEGTRNVLALGIPRILQMSALGTRTGAASDYHRTKWAAEELVRGSGAAWTIFRPSIIFGEGCEFIRQMLDLIHNPLFVPIAGSGRNLMQPISVRDVARYFVGALERPETHGQTYDLGGPKTYPFNQLMEIMIRARLGRDKPTMHAPIAALWPAALLQEWFFERPTFTRDQLKMLREDNAAETVPDFGFAREDFEAWCAATPAA